MQYQKNKTRCKIIVILFFESFALAFLSRLRYNNDMINLKVKNFQFAHSYNESGDLFVCDSHCHTTYELYLLVNGNVDYVVGNTTYSLKPFDLLLIPPTVFHCPHRVNHEPYERIIFNFNPTDINKNLRPLLDTLHTHYSVKNHLFFKSIVSEFTPSFAQLNKELFIRSVKNLIELSLTELSVLSPETDASSVSDPILSKIIEYIDHNLDKKLAQETMAKLFYVTPTWINYSFKKHFHICYSHYVKTKKMTYAQSLLQSGNSPTNVAVMCGFDAYATFLRQYKSMFQHLPTEDYIESIE